MLLKKQQDWDFYYDEIPSTPVTQGTAKNLCVHKKLRARFIVTVLVIEFSDLIFAFDSIPAVFSVSIDPYVVFFSNIFALLGLRSMFFLLAAIADKFRYLKIGVSVLLLFIGVKLLIQKYVEIDAVMSLVFILAVLVVSIILSLVIPQNKKV